MAVKAVTYHDDENEIQLMKEFQETAKVGETLTIVINSNWKFTIEKIS